jgi:hypothetical protein
MKQEDGLDDIIRSSTILTCSKILLTLSSKGEGDGSVARVERTEMRAGLW